MVYLLFGGARRILSGQSAAFFQMYRVSLRIPFTYNRFGIRRLFLPSHAAIIALLGLLNKFDLAPSGRQKDKRAIQQKKRKDGKARNQETCIYAGMQDGISGPGSTA
jgi:hypothetical protein